EAGFFYQVRSVTINTLSHSRQVDVTHGNRTDGSTTQFEGPDFQVTSDLANLDIDTTAIRNRFTINIHSSTTFSPDGLLNGSSTLYFGSIHIIVMVNLGTELQSFDLNSSACGQAVRSN